VNDERPTASFTRTGDLVAGAPVDGTYAVSSTISVKLPGR
jgi:hypothetical protein